VPHSDVVNDSLRRARAVLLVMSASVLVACGTLSKEECLTADWGAIGERDGSAGYAPQSRLAGHAKACAKAGVSPDQVLSVATEAEFLAAFNVGKTAHRARSDLDRAKRAVESKQREVTDKLKSFAGMTDAQRIAAQYDIAELNSQILEHQGDILRLSAEVARADQAVANYRQTLLNRE